MLNNTDIDNPTIGFNGDYWEVVGGHNDPVNPISPPAPKPFKPDEEAGAFALGAVIAIFIAPVLI